MRHPALFFAEDPQRQCGERGKDGENRGVRLHGGGNTCGYRGPDHSLRESW